VERVEMGGKTRPRTTDAAEILRRRYVEGNPEAEAMLDEVRAEADVARRLYRLRTGAGLTQQALAERVGTTASVISRLEDADYNGHSLAMLRRIAAALGRRVEIRFPAGRRAQKPAATGTTGAKRAGRRPPSGPRRSSK
jgi:ribosome-binding protein aMBF1 (putative translation factor)